MSLTNKQLDILEADALRDAAADGMAYRQPTLMLIRELRKAREERDEARDQRDGFLGQLKQWTKLGEIESRYSSRTRAQAFEEAANVASDAFMRLGRGQLVARDLSDIADAIRAKAKEGT